MLIYLRAHGPQVALGTPVCQQALRQLVSATNLRHVEISILHLPHETQFFRALIAQTLLQGNLKLCLFRFSFRSLDTSQPNALVDARVLVALVEAQLNQMYPQGSAFNWIERNPRVRPASQPLWDFSMKITWNLYEEHQRLRSTARVINTRE